MKHASYQIRAGYNDRPDGCPFTGLAPDRLAHADLDRQLVCESGSFTRAAHDMNLSQPSVSRIIGELEGRLGVKLLLRTTRQLTLTAAGKKSSVTFLKQPPNTCSLALSRRRRTADSLGRRERFPMKIAPIVDRSIEAGLVSASPAWLTNLTTRF